MEIKKAILTNKISKGLSVIAYETEKCKIGEYYKIRKDSVVKTDLKRRYDCDGNRILTEEEKEVYTFFEIVKIETCEEDGYLLVTLEETGYWRRALARKYSDFDVRNLLGKSLEKVDSCDEIAKVERESHWT